MSFDYYHGAESEQYSFIRIPKALFANPYLSLSISARLLYSLFLDRMSLSRRNKWIDDNNRVYIIYSTENLAKHLGLCTNTICKLLHELESFGLIERKRRGQGKPDLIYPKNFISAVNNNINVKTRRYCDAAITNTKCPDTQNIVSNNTNGNQTDEAILYPSISHVMTNDNPDSETWTRWMKYRSTTGHLPYDDILLTPAHVDCFVTTIIGDNNYTDDTLHSFADMVPNALSNLLTAPTTSVNSATVIPLQVLRLIDRRIDSIDMYPYISIDNIVATAVDDYSKGAKTAKIHNKLGYMRTCLYTALATGDADVDSDLLYDCH